MPRTTRERILDAAFQRVSEVGLTRLALEDVATAAGVSRQTLYRHFGSRDGLVEALVVREERWFIDRIVTATIPEQDVERAVTAAVTEALRAASEHALLRRLLQTEPGAILPLVILGEGPVISVAQPVVAEILGKRVEATPAAVDEAADVATRLLVSYVLDPRSEAADVVGPRIARILLRMLDVE